MAAVKAALKRYWNVFPLLTHEEEAVPAAADTLKATPSDLLNYNPSAAQPPQHILYAYGPSWRRDHWTSFDPECLKWQALLTFHGVPFAVNPKNEPFMSPSGELPFLVTLDNPDAETQVVAAPFTRLKVTNNGTNGGATGPRQRFRDIVKRVDDVTEDATAFLALVETKVRTAVLYNLWCEPENYEKATAPAYGRTYVFPLNKAIMFQRRADIVDLMLTTRSTLLRDEIYGEASQAFEALTERLGDDEYFSGTSTPSTLDAALFAYLHVTLTAPTPERELYHLVQRHKRLVEYSRNVWTKWFANKK